MKPGDLKEMANRCRLMAGTADAFTKRRLLDLASKYEARLEGRSHAAKRIAELKAVDEWNTDRQPGEDDPGYVASS